MRKIVNLLRKIIQGIKNVFNKSKDAKEAQGQSEFPFRKLTPVSDYDRMAVYKEAFKFAFSDPDIRNVAVSGPYSSGKSSVLETYKASEEGKNKKFIHIYLAHFQENTNGVFVSNKKGQDQSEDGGKDANGENKSRNRDAGHAELSADSQYVIEEKIIIQLLQYVSEDDVPLSSIQIKKPVKKCKYIVYACAVTFLLGVFLYFSHLDNIVCWMENISNQCLKFMLSFLNTDIFKFVLVMITAFVVTAAIYKFLYAQASKGILKKLNINGNELEIGTETEESYLDRYLSEIIYILDNIDADVIVFEDLDRFEASPAIFERLREINRLTNERRMTRNTRRRKSKKDSEKGLIRFFYLIRDDLFYAKDRTKFFDYIIPVIPIADGSNSFELLEQCLDVGSSDKKYSFNKSFLRNICLYIDDPRLLINIANEFIVYFESLSGIGLNPDKMLAIITYKNIFPSDFAQLQLRKGYVYQIFSRKEDLVKATKEKLRMEIKEIDDEIRNLDNEVETSVKDLEFIKSGRYNATKSHPSEKQGYDNWKENEYEKRKSYIEKYGMSSRGIKDLKKEKERLNDYFSNLGLMPVKEILKIITQSVLDKRQPREKFRWSDYLAGFNDKTENPNYTGLLDYLIMEGYIDESYSDYCTQFYAGQLSQTDKQFVCSVNEHREVSYDYPINYPMNVLDCFDSEKFARLGVLNFDLFKHMLETNAEENLRGVFKYLAENNKLTFLSEYYNSKNPDLNMIKRVNNIWPSFLAGAIGNGKVNREFILDYCVRSVCICSSQNLEEMNEGNIITEYISYQDDFLQKEGYDFRKFTDIADEEESQYFKPEGGLTEKGTNRFISNLHALNVKFFALQEEGSDEHLLREVYQNNLYEINESMLLLILHMIYGVAEEKLSKDRALLSKILSQSHEPLCEYCKTDFTATMASILRINSDNIEDEEEYVLYAINSPELSYDILEQYLKRCRTKIRNLRDVEDKSKYSVLITEDLISYSEENIICYFEDMGMTQELVDFIMSSNQKLDFTGMSTATMDKMVDSMVKNEKLSAEKFRAMVKSSKKKYPKLTDAGWEILKVIVLTEENSVTMNSVNLDFIRKHYSAALPSFIASDPAKYKALPVSYQKQNEIEAALQCKNLSAEGEAILNALVK